MKIVVDEGTCRLGADTELLRQAEAAHAVDDAEIDYLGFPPHLLCDEIAHQPEYFSGCAPVDIFLACKGLGQEGIPREVGQDAKLYLGIVSREDDAPWFGYERVPDFSPLGAANGDILEVGVAAAEPAGSGNRLIVGGVDATRLRVDEAVV